jgi:hypothetical protein
MLFSEKPVCISTLFSENGGNSDGASAVNTTSPAADLVSCCFFMGSFLRSINQAIDARESAFLSFSPACSGSFPADVIFSTDS